jgi:hypothetical protein
MLKTRLLAAAFLAAFTIAACGSAAAPSPSAPSATPRSTPTAVPGDPGSAGGSGGGGGTTPGGGGGSDPGSGGNTGGGIVIPIPGNPNDNPLLGNATYVTPAQGLLNLHAVNVQLVRAVVNDDRTATADLRWWSGVEPCSQLDSVQIERDETAKTIRLKVIEGSRGGQVACIDIAQLTATQVNLGTLASGTWTISADGDAPAIKLDIP